MRILRPALLCAPALLTACHLVDQRDFNPKAGMKPVPPVVAAPAHAGPAALVTIVYSTPEPAYAAELATAVQRALTLKANVAFTVQVLVPLEPSPEAQGAALAAATPTGREIAEAIVADGAENGQVEVLVKTDPAVSVKEVRVFVH